MQSTLIKALSNTIKKRMQKNGPKMALYPAMQFIVSNIFCVLDGGERCFCFKYDSGTRRMLIIISRFL